MLIVNMFPVSDGFFIRPMPFLNTMIDNIFLSNSLLPFLVTLSPGVPVALQFDNQLVTSGIFQGFSNGAALFTNFNGFPGLTRISVNSINAFSV